jgi:hypothetical protein
MFCFLTVKHFFARQTIFHCFIKRLYFVPFNPDPFIYMYIYIKGILLLKFTLPLISFNFIIYKISLSTIFVPLKFLFQPYLFQIFLIEYQSDGYFTNLMHEETD